jgi:hypothetical protein
MPGERGERTTLFYVERIVWRVVPRVSLGGNMPLLGVVPEPPARDTDAALVVAEVGGPDGLIFGTVVAETCVTKHTGNGGLGLVNTRARAHTVFVVRVPIQSLAGYKRARVEGSSSAVCELPRVKEVNGKLDPTRPTGRWLVRNIDAQKAIGTEVDMKDIGPRHGGLGNWVSPEGAAVSVERVKEEDVAGSATRRRDACAELAVVTVALVRDAGADDDFGAF